MKYNKKSLMNKKTKPREKEPKNSDMSTDRISVSVIIGVVTVEIALLSAAFTFGRYYEETQQKEKIIEIKKEHLRESGRFQTEILGLKEEIVTYKHEVLSVKSSKEQKGNGKKSK